MIQMTHFKPYKDIQFNLFLKNIGNAKIHFWLMYAKGLSVSRSTIYRWRKHPLFQQVLIEAVGESLNKMMEKGKNDWRMWNELIKMRATI